VHFKKVVLFFSF